MSARNPAFLLPLPSGDAFRGEVDTTPLAELAASLLDPADPSARALLAFPSPEREALALVLGLRRFLGLAADLPGRASLRRTSRLLASLDTGVLAAVLAAGPEAWRVRRPPGSRAVVAVRADAPSWLPPAARRPVAIAAVVPILPRPSPPPAAGTHLGWLCRRGSRSMLLSLYRPEGATLRALEAHLLERALCPAVRARYRTVPPVAFDALLEVLGAARDPALLAAA